jgi:hypothetical protein
MPFRRAAGRNVAAGLACVLLAACQAVLGFEDFEKGSSSVGADGGTGGTSHGPDASGPRDEGVACSKASDCNASFTCLFGRCRTTCDDDTGCKQDHTCLFAGTAGGWPGPA